MSNANKPEPVFNPPKPTGLPVNTSLYLSNSSGHMPKMLQGSSLSSFNIAQAVFDVANVVSHRSELDQNQVVRFISHIYIMPLKLSMTRAAAKTR